MNNSILDGIEDFNEAQKAFIEMFKNKIIEKLENEFYTKEETATIAAVVALGFTEE